MNTIKVNEKLAILAELAPIIQEALPFDASVGVTDKEKFLVALSSKELVQADVTGQPIPKGDAILTAMETKQPQFVSVPGEVFGVPFKAKAVPIKDEHGNVIGGLGFGASLNNQEKLSEMSKQLAANSEEISASTEEIATSAEDLAKVMESLHHSQKEMDDQVKKTESILDFINQVARSSRILGFNAGIEAARSGEHGRGFSVVAKEITKLADSSAKSVEEIRELFVLLKEKVDYIAETVNKAKEISQQQSLATEDLASVMYDLAVAAEGIGEFAKKI